MGIIWTIAHWVIFAGAALAVLSDKGDSGRRAAWIIFMAVLPLLGLILYLCLGVNCRHPRYHERKHRRYSTLSAEGYPEWVNVPLHSETALEEIDPHLRPLGRLLSCEDRPMPSSGNDLEVICSGKRKYELLMQDIAHAKEYIHMEYYLFGDDKWSDPVKDALIAKAKEGVKVRFIRENVANYSIGEKYYDQMKEAGIEVLKFTDPEKHFFSFLPRLNYRDHRKIVVIDGLVGYTGGMNIKDRYFEKWRDTHLRIQGPAVNSLQHIFLDTWVNLGGEMDRPLEEYFTPDHEFRQTGTDSEGEGHWEETGIASLDSPIPVVKDTVLQTVPDDPSSAYPACRMGYEWILNNAREYVYLQTPYFVPPESILSALKGAALRGVDVRVMIPAEAETWFIGPANNSYIRECLASGIRIFLRGGQFIHSKTLVCDDSVSIIGSSNIDPRSFDINYEINTFIYGERACLLNKEIFFKDCEVSTETDLQTWIKRPWYSVLWDNLLRLFSPLL